MMAKRRAPSVHGENVMAPQSSCEMYLADLSHEIRNPLNGIVAMADLLLQGPLTTDQRACAETILAAAASLVTTADGLLESSVQEPGTYKSARHEPKKHEPSAPESPPPKSCEPVSIRVLVAEDNATNQLVVRSLLERMGHECTVVENGRLAVEAVQARHFDLILMDCMMPELDGFDATREIRNLATHEAQIPIIALTANAMKGDREKCLDAGMSEYMAKPVRLALLTAMLERFGPDGSQA